ncbi:MAG: hypothetical protein WC526_03260 [Patescibacteria group bacterium]
MKIHPSHLIIGSIILLLLDFFVLANKTIFPGNGLEGIAAIIFFICVFIFVAGIVWAIFAPISKRMKSRPEVVTPVTVPKQSQFALTTLEMVFNRLFAVLLVLSTIPLFLNILSLPTIILFAVFVLFLWFGKKYHPVANIIFLIFALGIYFVPIPPLDWGIFRGLKEIRLNGFNFYVISTFFSIAPLIFISLAIRNVLGNIFVYFKTSTVWRNFFYFISLFIVSATLLVYPFFGKVRLRDRTENVNIAIGGDLPLVYTQQSLTFVDRYNKAGDFTSRFDPSSKKYIYHLQLLEPLQKDIQFTKVETDNEKINFKTDSRVVCPNCLTDAGDPYRLVFPAGKGIDWTITSDQMIKVIRFVEPEDKAADFVFWK